MIFICSKIICSAPLAPQPTLTLHQGTPPVPLQQQQVVPQNSMNSINTIISPLPPLTNLNGGTALNSNIVAANNMPIYAPPPPQNINLNMNNNLNLVPPPPAPPMNGASIPAPPPPPPFMMIKDNKSKIIN